MRAPVPPTIGHITDNPMQRFGFCLLVAFLFIAFGRVPEMLPIPNLALVSALMSLTAAFLIGGVPPALGSRTGILLCLLSIWMIAATPFSVWKGGSVHLLKESWSRAFMTFVIVGATIQGVKQCRTTMYTLAWATGFIVLLSRFRGSTESGRLSLDTGTLQNPNDFAAYLLLGLPFCLYGIITKGEPKLQRFMGMFLVPVVATLVLKTGSRSGLLTFILVLVFLFFRIPARGKLVMIAPVAVIVVLLPFVLPKSVISRYATLVSDDVPMGESSDADRQAGFASSSSDARKNLLIKSLILTAKNPVFGVGPGMFSVAVSDYAKELGERQPWQQTHNTYTQVSSELGIPALVLYLLLLGHCIRAVNRVQKLAKNSASPDLQKLGNMAFCVQIAWIAFCINSLFGSFAYHIHVPMLAGITEAIRRASLPFIPAAEPALPRVRSPKLAAMARTR